MKTLSYIGPYKTNDDKLRQIYEWNLVNDKRKIGGKKGDSWKTKTEVKQSIDWANQIISTKGIM